MRGPDRIARQARGRGDDEVGDARQQRRIVETHHGLALGAAGGDLRRPAGAPPAYKYGVAKLYSDLGVPAVPMALNSGLFWPRREFLRFPGTIVLEILPPIEPGLSTEVFLERLQATIEPVANRLLAEAARSPHPPPLSEAVRTSAGLG
jgi:1-acyl-sn-glycerol-3-phosphate acyltransferase